MLSTKNKIQLLSILLNDIKNDISKYSNGIEYESLSVFEGEGNPLITLSDNNRNETYLSFNEKGKLEANTGNETKDKAIERKYKINWLLKSLSILLFFVFNIGIVSAQTPPERTWYYNQQGLKTTVKERWFEDAQGLKHGTYIKYFVGGKREILGHYIHGKKNGLWTNTIFSDYELIDYINFSNDEANGLYKRVDVPSKNCVIIEGNYTNGLETGYWKEGYDKENKIYSEGNYVIGKRNGEWKNTFATVRSKDEIEAERFYRFENNSIDKYEPIKAVETEVRKGYRSIFKDGEVIAIYDDKGINLFEKAKQEELIKQQKELIKQQEQIETEVRYCNTLSDFENFREKYPNSEFDSIAIIQIDKLKKEYEEWKRVEEKNKPDNDAFDSADNINDYLKYEKNFPNGIHIKEIQESLKTMVLKNLNSLYKEIPLKYFANGNINEAIVNCELILRYKNDIDKSYYYPTLIYYSLALWSIGEKDKAVDILKPAWNATIDYTNESVKFKDNYFSMYNQYKTQLHIDTDKETYKKIKAL